MNPVHPGAFVVVKEMLVASAVPKALVAKIVALPTDRIAEVEDFVDFLAQREAERAASRAMATASNPAFAAVWTNPEDDAYDAL